jgi:hypothetical protein
MAIRREHSTIIDRWTARQSHSARRCLHEFFRFVTIDNEALSQATEAATNIYMLDIKHQDS